MFLRAPNMCGKDVGMQGAACTAGKAILPMQSSVVNPKMPRTWFIVTALHGHWGLACTTNVFGSKDMEGTNTARQCRCPKVKTRGGQV